MKVSRLLFLASTVIVASAMSVPNANHVAIEAGDEPRLFFRQMVEASGLFPLELNVPDTVSAMMGGMSWMYQTAMSYFSGGGSEEQTETAGEGGESQVVKVKSDRKTKLKRNALTLRNMFDLIALLLL
jgi:hypothetical protein